MNDPDDTLPLLDAEDIESVPRSSADPQGDDMEAVADEWSGDDIEEAYQKALAAMDDVPWEAEAPEPAPGPGDAASADDATRPIETEMGATTVASDVPSTPFPGAEASHRENSKRADGPRLARGTERASNNELSEHSQVTPAQVIEAALFVGGGALSAKKICGLLRGSFDPAFVTKTIEELNEQYRAEGRPYEVILGDGGYRLELCSEFEKVRQRVYGSGPREVKLSQDVLEVLALVAYRQPISQPEVESHGKQNAGNVLRQLLRRDLVSIQRGEGGRKDIRYLTTPRFLQVFGLGSLDELPQPDDLARK